MDFRKIFDSIPEEFDRWRPRYCEELFADLIRYADLGSGKAALEVGPGTGQATEPILKTGCSYLAIELGENFTEFMKRRFGAYANFRIVNADFEIHDFSGERFDLLYSAAAFQWIPEKIGYPRAFELLKSGGTFAMFLTPPDLRPDGGYIDEPLNSRIQEVYAEFFHPETNYICSLDYDAREKYGFIDLERREYHTTREFDADSFVAHIATHSDHITLREPYRTKFFEGVRNAILDAGNKLTLYEKPTLYLAKKP
ncbi:MAG: methyltransferase domain-containing protein [Christensenellaceae bacterium]|nr:methyltransferase domain-containing protein [Christensenellaceae bacterium]